MVFFLRDFHTWYLWLWDHMCVRNAQHVYIIPKQYITTYCDGIPSHTTRQARNGIKCFPGVIFGANLLSLSCYDLQNQSLVACCMQLICQHTWRNLTPFKQYFITCQSCHPWVLIRCFRVMAAYKFSGSARTLQYQEIMWWPADSVAWRAVIGGIVVRGTGPLGVWRVMTPGLVTHSRVIPDTFPDSDTFTFALGFGIRSESPSMIRPLPSNEYENIQL